MDDEQQKLIKKLNRRMRFTQFIAWMALFFTAVGIAAGYKNWLRIHDKAKANIVEIKQIKQELPQFSKKTRVAALEKNLNENLVDSKEHLDSAMSELRSIQDSTQHIAETVYTQVVTLTKQQATVKIQSPSIEDWSLGEVHFLLQTAVQRFNLKQDKQGAISAFKLADTLLVERGSLALLPVRKQISQDIAAIKQYAAVDVTALSNQINTLLNQLKPLPANSKVNATVIELLPTKNINKANSPDNNKQPNPIEAKKHNQESLVTRVRKTINDAVVIRKYNKPIISEMDTVAKERIYQLLSLRLETLRMMLFQSDDENYHQQIQRLKTLILDYYPEKQNTAVQKQLDQLNTVNLSPSLPDISKSLKLLKDHMGTINTK
ncbi:MAG TPA: hypothetical protein EYH16_05120 [Leucothrix mucor]|nr:hypothetical protein [Leucothrix mucor]